MADQLLVPAVRLAAHELNDLMQKQYQEAKLRRLNQVRGQAAEFAKQVRQAGQEKRKRELKKVEDAIRQKTQAELDAIVQEMENGVLECLTQFGGAHTQAGQENSAGYDLIRQADFSRNRQKAQRLGKDALRDLQLQRQETNREQNKRIACRQQALETEAVRSAHIVSLPPIQFVRDPKPEVKEPQKVMLFDKSTLFQTEYVMKEPVVEAVHSPKDAREAAARYEVENLKTTQDKERQKAVNNAKIRKRGQEALVKEKSHSNYLRLLEELEKMENSKPCRQWEVESTASADASTLSDSSKASSPPPSQRWNDVEETPVRDRPKQSATCSSAGDSAPNSDREPTDETLRPLSVHDTRQLIEIGRLLKELRHEQAHLTADGEDGTRRLPPCNRPSSTCTPSSSPATSSSSSGVVVYSDDDVEIRCGINHLSGSSSSQEQQRRNEAFANALSAIRREREQLDSALDAGRTKAPVPIKPPGILRRTSPAPSLASSATSTPLSQSHHSRPQGNNEASNSRKQILRHYVERLLAMKRADVSKLSVSTSASSSSSSNGASTPKPSVGLVHTTHPHRPVGFKSPTQDWSRHTESSSSAYDSPVTDHSSSKISNASSLPLGAEASAFRKPTEGDVSVGPLSLGPLLDVYNDVYQAYNQRRQMLNEEKLASLQRTHDSLTESSFMSLTLSGTSSNDRGPFRHRPNPQQVAGDQSSVCFELTLSSSSSSGISNGSASILKELPVKGHRQQHSKQSTSSFELTLSSTSSSSSVSRSRSLREWAMAGHRSSKTPSITLSDSSSSGALGSKSVNTSSSFNSSQDVSMPDVDEALRRLGLPSMQSVLRR